MPCVLTDWLQSKMLNGETIQSFLGSSSLSAAPCCDPTPSAASCCVVVRPSVRPSFAATINKLSMAAQTKTTPRQPHLPPGPPKEQTMEQIPGPCTLSLFSWDCYASGALLGFFFFVLLRKSLWMVGGYRVGPSLYSLCPCCTHWREGVGGRG